jgi:hypothetical protein
MIKTTGRHSAVRYLLPCLTLLIGFLAGYVFLSTGLADALLIARNRPHALNKIEAASNCEPPDIGSLATALDGPDWLVAAVAAERIGLLWQSDRLDSEQADLALDSLFQALAAGGHWWRFGWDREEPEFQQFRGAAIEATAKFGSAALPRLSRAVRGHSPFEREAACWIVLSMIKDSSVDQTSLFEAGLLDGVRDLAKNDSEPTVRESCLSAITRIESEGRIDRPPYATETPDPE